MKVIIGRKVSLLAKKYDEFIKKKSREKNKKDLRK